MKRMNDHRIRLAIDAYKAKGSIFHCNTQYWGDVLDIGGGSVTTGETASY